MADDKVTWHSRSLYLGKGGYASEVLIICSICGAAVFTDFKNNHEEWHEEIDELVDWARSVSELFKRPEPDASEDKRRISSEHAGQYEASIKDRFDTGSSEEGLQKGSE